MWRLTRLDILPPTLEDGSLLASKRSVKRLNQTFHNRTGRTIECLWIDFSGKPVYYNSIADGSKALFYTFRHHPWFFRFAPATSPEEAFDSNFIVVEELNKQVAFPTKKHPTMTLKMATPATWTPANHKKHCKADSAFGAGVRILLMAHHRLRCHPELQMQQDSQQLSLPSSGTWNMLKLAVRYCNAHCLRPQPTSGSVSTTHTAAASAPACDSTPDKMTALDNQAAQSQQSATCHSITPAISCSNLGDLPLDVVLEIVKRWAPPVVPDVFPLLASDMEDEEGEDMEQWGWQLADGQAAVLPGNVWGNGEGSDGGGPDDDGDTTDGEPAETL